MRSPLGSFGGHDGHLVCHGGHGQPGGAVGRHVAAGDDDQVAERLLVSDQVESHPLARQDHGAVQDTVVPWRDATFTIQVGQRLHIQRRLGLPDVHGDREAGRAATQDADAPGAQQPLEAFGGDPVDGAAGGGGLGELCRSRMASACASAATADRRRTRPPTLTTTPVATSRTTVMTWASESITSVW